MMEEDRGVALIFVPDGVDPEIRFAGRTLAERSAALARTAGLRPILVGRSPAAPPTGAGAVDWLPPGGRLPTTPGPPATVVLWRCDVVWTAGTLRGFLAQAGERRVVARDDGGRIALLRLPGTRLGGVVPASLELAAAGAVTCGDPGRVGGDRMIALSLDEAGRDARLRVAERELVATLRNPRDGAIDRVFNRHLSRRVSPGLLRFPITPNQVTLLSLLVGVAAACALAAPGSLWPIVGALLLQLTAVLDCVDGEIARAKVLESDWGEWLDITTDTTIHVLVFLGMAVHAWPELGSSTAWTLGILFATGGFASFLVVTRAEKTEEIWLGVDAWPSRLLATLLATLTTRDLSVLVLAAAVTGTLTELLEGAAVGAHVFWVTTLLLHTSVMRRAARPEPAAEAPELPAESGAEHSAG